METDAGAALGGQGGCDTNCPIVHLRCTALISLGSNYSSMVEVASVDEPRFRMTEEICTLASKPKAKKGLKNIFRENQDGGIGRHTAPPRTTRTDRESNGKGVRHEGNKK